MSNKNEMKDKYKVTKCIPGFQYHELNGFAVIVLPLTLACQGTHQVQK